MKPNMGDMCEMAGKSAKNGITEGVIWKQILIFFFPILIGTFFQQLYNTVDAVVVGRFAGKEALSSVGGSSSQIINFVVGFFTGLSAGSTVIIAQYYGAKNRDGLHRALHTAYAFSAVFGILAGIIGVFATPAILRMMKTPDNLMAIRSCMYRFIFPDLSLSAFTISVQRFCVRSGTRSDRLLSDDLLRYQYCARPCARARMPDGRAWRGGRNVDLTGNQCGARDTGTDVSHGRN